MPKQRSVMQHRFSEVPDVKVPRSQLDRSHGHKATFDAGYLVPVFVDEVLPGDTFNLRMSAFARLATPLKPIMDNIFLDSFFFFIPLRLLWDNFERFMGAQDNPADSTDFTVPTMAEWVTAGTLSDYIGIPPTPVQTVTFDTFWHRGYNFCWNEWFRDQDLQDSVLVPTGDGPDSPGDFVLLRRGKRHDYFTSCRPWPQKGDAINLPLGTQAPITGIGKTTQGFPTANNNVWETDAGATTQYPWSAQFATTETWWGRGSAQTGGIPEIYADLTNATAATVNELRQAFQLQKMLEKDARGGTRYTEKIRSHFGVTSPDARLQRPEYLGGGSSPINITPVPQTSTAVGATAEEQQGNLAAYGTASIRGHGFVQSFTEHGILIGLVSARADLTYQQGLHRMFSRQTREEFYWPSLAHIGEQAVLQQEIWAEGVAADTDVFGYQERYAEYRYKPSNLSGLFRSTAAGTLDVWHLSQEFASAPTLDDTFIEENPPIDRVIAVPSEPHFIADFYFSLKTARPMPVFGVPGLIDHF